MGKIIDELLGLLEPIVHDYGLELVDMEYRRESKGWVLRLYVDKPGGVSVEDCAKASREIGTFLDVKDVIPNPYSLEVSSPGLDRPLKKEADFAKFIGRSVRIKTFAPIEGSRNFSGILEGFEEGSVKIAADNKSIKIPLTQIAKANLVYDNSKP